MLSPLDSGEGILVTAAIRDISIRKAAEKELRESEGLLAATNRELAAFTYSVSHDLRATDLRPHRG